MNDLRDWFEFSIAIAGLLIGMYTLRKVRKVAAAQKQERDLTQDLLGVDLIEVDLVRVITKLSSIGDQDSISLSADLSRQLGAIQGVRRALNTGDGDTSRTAVSLERGFFGEEFIAAKINGSRTCIDIVTGRTFLASGFYILDCLSQACERGVRVRLVGLSDDAPEETLQDSLKTVSNPVPADVEEYRQQIRENKRSIVAAVRSWSTAAQSNFGYRLNASVPRITLLRSDATVCIGFLQLYRDAQPPALKDREYISLSVASGSGSVCVSHFDLVWNEEGGPVVWPSPTGVLGVAAQAPFKDDAGG